MDLTHDTMLLIDMLDQRLPYVQEVELVIRVAIACLTESPRSRPTMQQVCKQLVKS
jgi:hypothetical protein